MFRSLLVLLSALCTVTPQIFIEDGYYWRDYRNKIPGDAVPGGSDRSGAPIYIGQALYTNNLMPGKICSNNSNIYFHYMEEQQADKNVKILCSPFHENFEWISTNLNEVTKLTDKGLINAGYEPNSPFSFVGRIFSGGETTIGKVTCQLDNSCTGLWHTQDGRGLHYLGPFEVLVYKFDKV